MQMNGTDRVRVIKAHSINAMESGFMISGVKDIEAAARIIEAALNEGTPEDNESQTKLEKLKGNDVVTITCQERGVSIDRIIGKGRKEDVVECRHIITHYLYYIDHWHKNQIADLIGQDRTTILRSIRVAANDLETNKRFKEVYNNITMLINEARAPKKEEQ